MAIIPSVPGVRAEVRISGEQAQEYADSSGCGGDNTTTRYIEAISGAKFTIHCKIWHPYDIKDRDVRVRIWVDGERIRGKILERKRYDELRGEMDIEGAMSVQNGHQVMAPMIFSELDIDENDPGISGCNLQEKVASVGDIRIQFEIGQGMAGTMSDSTTVMDAIGKIPEEDLKGRTLSHQVKLQEYKPTAQCGIWTFVPDREGTVATFVFKYRSKSALQAEGIIPRTRQPTPLEERPLEELNPEELRELLRRHRERDAAAEAVKREFKAEDIDSDSKTSIDLAQSDDVEITAVRPVKRQRISGPDEAIDLTFD